MLRDFPQNEHATPLGGETLKLLMESCLKVLYCAYPKKKKKKSPGLFLFTSSNRDEGQMEKSVAA